MQKVVVSALLLLLIICLAGHAQNQTATAVRAHRIVGFCRSFGAEVPLKANVFILTKQGRTKLFTCQEDGKFSVLVPETATYLNLELDGYQTVSIPLHFTPKIPAEARFQIWELGIMTPKNRYLNNAAPVDSASLPVQAIQETVLSPYFQPVDGSDVDRVFYELKSLTTSKIRAMTSSINQSGNLHNFLSVPPGTYMATLFAPNHCVISTEKITIKPGFNLKSIRVGKPLCATAISNPDVGDAAFRPPAPIRPAAGRAVPDKASARSTATVYFDQSSHNLRSTVKPTLDSIARLLVGQRNLRIIVTGYTDNVGRPDLNLILSEYRARTVATYLSQCGVLPNQMIIKWLGFDTITSPTDTEILKTLSRRVVVNIIPE